MKKKKTAWYAMLVLAGVLVLLAGCQRAEEKKSSGAESVALAETEASESGALSETEASESGALSETEASESGAMPETEASESSALSGTDRETGAAGSGSAAQADAAEPQKQRTRVRGIYVTGAMAGTANMDNLIALVERTELNALVIDVKNDEGRVVCEMDVPLVNEIGSVKRYVRDMPALIQKCREKGIYLIARIVAFKDPFLAEAKPEWSLHTKDGSMFRDKSGLAWVNPYEKQVWEYLVEVSKEAVEMGFDEVQYDYIRFSTDKGMKDVDFGPLAQTQSKEEIITAFTAYAAEALHAQGAAVSADVYGIVIDSEVDQQIVGQDYPEMAKYLDSLCPMVYPSHYGPYNYDIPVPDAQPYDTVLAAMQASKKVLAGVEKEPETADVSGNDATVGAVSGNDGTASGQTTTEADSAFAAQERAARKAEIAALAPMPEVRAGVRPWLQDFTATWVKGHIQYGPQQIREQIQAVYDAGYDEWILWNAANRYTEEGLYGEEEVKDREEGDT